MSPWTFIPRRTSTFPSGRIQSDQFPTGWALYLSHGQNCVSITGYSWEFLHLSFFLLFPVGEKFILERYTDLLLILRMWKYLRPCKVATVQMATCVYMEQNVYMACLCMTPIIRCYISKKSSGQGSVQRDVGPWVTVSRGAPCFSLASIEHHPEAGMEWTSLNCINRCQIRSIKLMYELVLGTGKHSCTGGP